MNVHTICSRAFAQDSSLKTVTGNNLKYIGEQAFEDTALQTFDNTTVEYVGSKAFRNSALETVELPNCKYVGDNAFYNNTMLASVKIDSAKEISSQAFFGNNILSVVSANSVEFVGSYAFYKAGNGAYDTRQTKFSLSFPQLQTAARGAFEEMKGLESINLPECTSIGDEVFYKDINLTTVSCPKVRTIGNDAFREGVKIDSLYVPECTYIGSYNFYNNNTVLSEITLADGCELGSYCFRTPVQRIIGKIGKISEYCFNSINQLVYLDMDFSGVTSIADYCFSTSSELRLASEVVDLASCTSIGSNTFWNSSYLYGGVKKIWLRGDCTMASNSFSTLSAFSREDIHIYTDAAEKPSGWSNVLTSATWHYGATHEEFENA